MTEMLDLSDRDFKVAILKILQPAIMNILETYKKIESLSKEIENIKKNQIELLEPKNVLT